ncbi:hypothetical protein [Croceibacterium ferulae]|uniref:hypothetical protein n=1 Tax=Croceibacterium ferulae TaxID=1854641 RepID=UPI000F87657C|nr:hypothetical protein [Croceibacterium ferulae]
MIRIGFCFALFLILSGCSTLGIGPDQNSGQIDYRIAEPVSVTQRQIDQNSKDTPLAPARLVRRYSGAREAFVSTATADADRDVFSITLEQAVIGRFVGEEGFAQPAEIAILANAFEFDSADATTSSSRFYEFPEIMGPRTDENGKASEAAEGLKLVYFSPDVYLQQPLNFSALPIIPPSLYRGRPIGIQIVFLELDRMSGPLKSLLRELASLGQASNIANPLPGIADVALELGSSLLDANTNNDDIVFEYRMVLYPQHLTTTTDSGLPLNEMATFQPGRYVLRRVEERSTQVEWDSLRLDHNTGRLFNGDSGSEVRDDTYVVMNVIRHPRGTPEARYLFRSLAQFDEMLTAASQTDGSASLQVITDNIQARVAYSRSAAWLDELNASWNQLRQALANFDVARYPGSDANLSLTSGADCQLVPVTEIRPHWLEARLQVSQRATEFVEAYKRAESARVGDENSDSQLSAQDRKSLIDRLSLFSVPKNEALQASFASPEAFEGAYIDGKTGAEFADALIGAMENVPRDMSCSQLQARGWVQ